MTVPFVLDRAVGTPLHRPVVRGDAAGLHMTVRFSGAGNLAVRAGQCGVHLSSSDIYYVTRPARHEFILGFSAESERALREGVRRLALRD